MSSNNMAGASSHTRDRGLEYILRELEETIRVLDRLTSLDYNELAGDEIKLYALQYGVVKAVESIFVAGYRLLRGRRITDTTYRGIIRALRDNNIIPPTLSDVLEDFVGLRNIIIHRYWIVDAYKLYMEVRNRYLPALREFVRVVKSYAGVS